MPSLSEDDTGIFNSPQLHASTFLKQIDSSFEVFFKQRKYTERNFAFYLQVLAQQYKPKEAQEAFEKMITLGIKPTDFVYT